jgi:hypothetical protein
VQPTSYTAYLRELSPGEPSPIDAFEVNRQAAHLVYQGMTIAAMLLLLCSLWVF